MHDFSDYQDPVLNYNVSRIGSGNYEIKWQLMVRTGCRWTIGQAYKLRIKNTNPRAWCSDTGTWLGNLTKD